MKIQLIKGEFSNTDSIDLLKKIITAKIEFHEDKIQSGMNEEDIKLRENKIKNLQTYLQDVQKYVSQKGDRVAILSHIELG